MDDPDGCRTDLADGACGVRFPSSLAIAQLEGGANPGAAEWTDTAGTARVEIAEDTSVRKESAADEASSTPGEAHAPDDGAFPQLAAISPADQGRWVEAFRGLIFIGDLRFLGPIDLKSRCDGLPAVLAAAQRAEAGLLLTYAPSRCGPNSARVVGILYAVKSGRPLARLQSHMQFLNVDGEECSVDEMRGDQREQDAVYQAARDFECRAVCCVRELACSTPAATTTEPHRWVPLYPYCWQPLGRPQACPPIPPAAPGEKP
jgi:hypothetical protein